MESSAKACVGWTLTLGSVCSAASLIALSAGGNVAASITFLVLGLATNSAGALSWYVASQAAERDQWHDLEAIMHGAQPN